MLYLILASAIGLVSMTAYAEDQTPTPAAGASAATNTIDPVNGQPIDKSIAPVSAKTSDGKDVMIGASSQTDADKIKEDPAKYADAAAKDQTCSACGMNAGDQDKALHPKSGNTNNENYTR